MPKTWFFTGGARFRARPISEWTGYEEKANANRLIQNMAPIDSFLRCTGVVSWLDGSRHDWRQLLNRLHGGYGERGFRGGLRRSVDPRV